VVTIWHVPPQSPRIVEFETDCRIRRMVCREVSFVCVSVKNNRRVLHSSERHYESIASKYDLVFS